LSSGRTVCHRPQWSTHMIPLSAWWMNVRDFLWQCPLRDEGCLIICFFDRGEGDALAYILWSLPVSLYSFYVCNASLIVHDSE
jgi:hypothetical protein